MTARTKINERKDARRKEYEKENETARRRKTEKGRGRKRQGRTEKEEEGGTLTQGRVPPMENIIGGFGQSSSRRVEDAPKTHGPQRNTQRNRPRV